ncbi:GTPase Era [Erysipelotrichaceae bacterium OttesenSCG-928-M19]|nr:GTPase Era [Erysipelotrichaceae bacterium OttesenSCG-928-M19]
MFKSGFVAIVGRPNVGKSTLLNSFLKHKVAIMSNKPQTTRNKIQGIYTDDEAQIIFIDTPGIHKPKSNLSTFMNKSAYSATNDVEIILFLTNIDQPMSTGDKMIIDNLRNSSSKVFLVLNKIDLVSKEYLFNYLNELSQEYQDIFTEIIPISAKNKNNTDHLLAVIKDNLNEGIKYYPDEMISDHPEQFIFKEIIREKILMLTGEEIPHSIAVTIDNVKRKKDESLLIQATIIVERESQKGIIIGKNGAKLKEIGILAREELELILGSKIYLETFVKVEKNWRNRQFQLNEFGYNDEDY